MSNARENVNLLTSADWDIATLRLANWGSGAVPPHTSNPFNGRLYSLALLGRTANVPELSAMEAWVNGKTGAY